MLLPASLQEQINQVVRVLPQPTLESLIQSLDEFSCYPSETKFITSLLQSLPRSNFRHRVAELIQTWEREASHLDSRNMSIALCGAASGYHAAREDLSIELVWTGPNPVSEPLRRTEQVLLQLINGAQRELLVVSFAVYKIPAITSALWSAISRGVSVRVVVETAEASEGKVSYNSITSLGRDIGRKASVYIWPQEMRPKDREGRHGSLHIKCIVADSEQFFISSANLTAYAFTLNMEMGIAVRSKESARLISGHFDDLISRRTLIPVEN